MKWEEILASYANTGSYAETARHLGISRQRVHQVVTGYKSHKLKRRQRQPGVNKDAEGYLGADSGCKKATEELGYQSHCLLCPFPECRLIEIKETIYRTRKSERNSERNSEIRQAHETEKDLLVLASRFHISIRTIRRVLKAGEE